MMEREDNNEALRSQLKARLNSGPNNSELQKLVWRVSRLTSMEACKEARDVEGEAFGEGRDRCLLSPWRRRGLVAFLERGNTQNVGAAEGTAGSVAG